MIYRYFGRFMSLQHLALSESSPCPRAYVPSCPITLLIPNAAQRRDCVYMAARAPWHVRVAAEYCCRRGATLTHSVELVDTSTGRWWGWSYRSRLRIAGAPRTDSVALRLAGFVPVDNEWLWKEVDGERQ